jgi:hypothetical protein
MWHPGPSGIENGGPWDWAHPDQLPYDWYNLPSYPGFQNNGSLTPYVGNFDGISVVDKLREVEDTNFVNFLNITQPPVMARFTGYRVKAFSMETPVIPELRRPESMAVTKWNLLRRDREQRLYCGFSFSPEDRISDNGAHSNERYNAIFCSDGWYRASNIDYMKEFDIDFATSLIGAGGI